MSFLSKFIDTLSVRFIRGAFLEVIHPAMLNGYASKQNVIVMLNKGSMYVGRDKKSIAPGSFWFFPAGQPIFARHGNGKYHDLGKEGFLDIDNRNRYLKSISGLEDFESKKEIFTVVLFETLLYNAIPFFEILGIPDFPLPEDEEFGYLINRISLECEQQKIGRDRIIENYIEEIFIHMCRYMDQVPDLKRHLEKLEYLTDRRLVDIVKYIHENLEKDLSNETMASVACVSVDYVGQFFKTLTGKNLQEFIENQRLEKAMRMLKTQPGNIQEIALQVGFKDAAYFSRRFKLKYGVNANSLRRRRFEGS